MGKRGPVRTPTQILKLRGSWRGKARDKVEPKPERGAPPCPDWISDAAKVVWEQLIPQLEDLNVLAKVDVYPLARYCQMFVQWREVEDFIAKRGTVYPLKDKNGDVRCIQQFPQVSIANKLAVALLRLEQEFGLTPAARARIQLPLNNTKGENEFEIWQRKYRR